VADLNSAFAEGIERNTSQVRYIDLPNQPNGAPISLPVAVLAGADDGPTVWISSAVHGDEINGVDICRHLLRELDVATMAGTLLVLPIVDVYGFNVGSRYLPDRRDLNRSFPGRKTGSLAARVAHAFVTQVVDRCDAGIDLHSGAQGRTNLPQVRGVVTDSRVADLSAAFAAPITVHSKVIEGSLREVATKRDIPYVLFEGGAASHFDPYSRDVAVAGCQRLLHKLGVISESPPVETDTIIVTKTRWERAPESGVLDALVSLGNRVEEGQRLALVTDTFGDQAVEMTASNTGIVIGMATDPLVQGGDAVFNIGQTE